MRHRLHFCENSLAVKFFETAFFCWFLQEALEVWQAKSSLIFVSEATKTQARTEPP